MNKIHQMITDRMIKRIEQTGELIPQRLWHGQGGWPKNLVSKKPYRGVNVFMLAFAGFASPYWLSYKQAQGLGGQVRKGEKSTPIVFWKLIDSKKQEGKVVPLLRYYAGFNATQCDGLEGKIPVSVPDREITPIESCEAIVQGYEGKPPIINGGRCSFSPSLDRIQMVRQEQFVSDEKYYSTLFHELTHSTGHADRLNRSGITSPIKRDSKAYCKEELIAEMGASFLSAEAGILHHVQEDNAAYLNHYLDILREDPGILISAGSQAQKAFDHIVPAVEEVPHVETTEEAAA